MSTKKPPRKTASQTSENRGSNKSSHKPTSSGGSVNPNPQPRRNSSEASKAVIEPERWALGSYEHTPSASQVPKPSWKQDGGGSPEVGGGGSSVGAGREGSRPESPNSPSRLHGSTASLGSNSTTSGSFGSNPLLDSGSPLVMHHLPRTSMLAPIPFHVMPAPGVGGPMVHGNNNMNHMNNPPPGFNYPTLHHNYLGSGNGSAFMPVAGGGLQSAPPGVINGLGPFVPPYSGHSTMVPAPIAHSATSNPGYSMHMNGNHTQSNGHSHAHNGHAHALTNGHSHAHNGHAHTGQQDDLIKRILALQQTDMEGSGSGHSSATTSPVPHPASAPPGGSANPFSENFVEQTASSQIFHHQGHGDRSLNGHHHQQGHGASHHPQPHHSQQQPHHSHQQPHHSHQQHHIHMINAPSNTHASAAASINQTNHLSNHLQNVHIGSNNTSPYPTGNPFNQPTQPQQPQQPQPPQQQPVQTLPAIPTSLDHLLPANGSTPQVNRQLLDHFQAEQCRPASTAGNNNHNPLSSSQSPQLRANSQQSLYLLQQQLVSQSGPKPVLTVSGEGVIRASPVSVDALFDPRPPNTLKLSTGKTPRPNNPATLHAHHNYSLPAMP